MRPRTKVAAGLAAGAAALAIGIPVAIGQSPQSILPPGFGAPPKAAPAQPAAPSRPDDSDQVQELPTLTLAPPTQDEANAAANAQDEADNAANAAEAAAEALRKQDIPDFARRPRSCRSRPAECR